MTMAENRIKRVEIYFEKTDRDPVLMAKLPSIKMADTAIEEFGNFTHFAQSKHKEMRGLDELTDNVPALIRVRFSDYKAEEFGFKFMMYDNGVFNSCGVRHVGRLYYRVIR